MISSVREVSDMDKRDICVTLVLVPSRLLSLRREVDSVWRLRDSGDPVTSSDC